MALRIPVAWQKVLRISALNTISLVSHKYASNCFCRSSLRWDWSSDSFLAIGSCCFGERLLPAEILTKPRSLPARQKLHMTSSSSSDTRVRTKLARVFDSSRAYGSIAGVNDG